MDQSQPRRRIFDSHTSKQITNNRLKLKASIDTIQFLAFQGCAFRGRDKNKDSINHGNFLELLELVASYNENVKEVVLDKASQNASYTSGKIQKKFFYKFYLIN